MLICEIRIIRGFSVPTVDCRTRRKTIAIARKHYSIFVAFASFNLCGFRFDALHKARHLDWRANVQAFAEMLGAMRDAGARDLVFLIGGPDGLDSGPAVKPGRRLAFGPQTWPHLLVRVMLAEQIYRALTILGNHPYHRG